jgi:hypothetical protein
MDLELMSVVIFLSSHLVVLILLLVSHHHQIQTIQIYPIKQLDFDLISNRRI